MIGWMRIAFVAAMLSAVTLAFWPVQVLALRKGGRGRLCRSLPVTWHRIACRLVGIRIEVVGSPSHERPLLIAANHQSWSDILVLGSIMPLAFIAKSEVADWPVFGFLAKLQRTIFVERKARGRTRDQAHSIAERLTQGDAMVLFAEGTTSDGNEVLPFKTALFGAAQAAVASSACESVAVQPVAIAYTRANGLPLGRFARPLAAWPGDVELLPHLLAFIREGAMDVTVSFGEPIAFDGGSDRKLAARRSRDHVAGMLADSLAGRPCRDRQPPMRTRMLAPRHDGVDIGG